MMLSSFELTALNQSRKLNNGFCQQYFHPLELKSLDKVHEGVMPSLETIVSIFRYTVIEYFLQSAFQKQPLLNLYRELCYNFWLCQWLLARLV